MENNNKTPKRKSEKQNNRPKPNGMNVSRGAAIRAQKRSQDDARKIAEQYSAVTTDRQNKRANVLTDDFDKLKISFLGGMEEVGEKNTAVIEYQNDAIVLDCGINLSIDLPGINYEIADPTYLAMIKHKIKGYVITHGHLDHIGGLKHVVPRFPAPIYGSRFTLGVVEKSFEELPTGVDPNFKPKLMNMNIDNHEKLKIGAFFIELIRITHSIPDSTSVSIDTPIGKVIATGDFRLDPEPLDNKPSDVNRLKQLGDEGVEILLTESSYSIDEGRTPTEHTLVQSFKDVISKSQGRIFCAVFSSNMNRIQMIIDAAVENGRKVAFDGRSMMAYAEIAVKQGILKVPKGTLVAMRDTANLNDDQLLVMCTGGQGEPNAALQRMSEGNHSHIKLKAGDNVIVSSSPIPGNEIRYDQIGNNLASIGVNLFRHPTHEVDGCGPLHVSGHARRDEMREMINLVRPKFVIPVHGGMLRRKYHAEIAVQEGVDRNKVFLGYNGASYQFDGKTGVKVDDVPAGSLLVDQTSAIISNIVVKDRIMLAEEGLVTVVLTVDRKTGGLMTSPDIITRGFIYIRDNEELMSGLRTELKRAVAQRFKRIDLDRFKAELKDHVTHFLYDKTQRSPIVIPVVNIVGGSGQKQSTSSKKSNDAKSTERKNDEAMAIEQQERFAEMRKQLLNQKSFGD